MLELETDSQDRIYACEFCRTENQVRNTISGWRAIDEGQPSIDLNEHLSSGKPTDESAERAELGQNFDSLQKLSLGLGTAAVALGGLAVADSHAGGGLWRLGALILSGCSAVALFLNVIPLRQPAHPPQKLLRQRSVMRWRYRLTVTGAVLFIFGVTSVFIARIV
ncbi:hypothetical protein [Streptomyces olivaceiscleroticus]|uniref:hypothetical protein n=1 Tax=Streptomyces olivaceiscleroticus TaxID=68245 RepID=UPI0031F84187